MLGAARCVLGAAQVVETLTLTLNSILTLNRTLTLGVAPQVVATRKALQHAQAELHLIGEELAQARREVSLTKREQARLLIGFQQPQAWHDACSPPEPPVHAIVWRIADVCRNAERVALVRSIWCLY